jgi:hypothetical protein
MVQIPCIHVYKLKLVETIQGRGDRVYRRMMEWVSSTMIYLVYCKNFCKCHNVPSAQQ